MNLGFVTFKNLVLLLALPPAPWLLLAAWGGWRLHHRRRGGAWLLGLALALVWLCSTEAVGELLMRAAGGPPALSLAQIDTLRGRPDGVVLVLGGGVRQSVPELGGGAGLKPITAERLAYGVWLARRSGWPLAFAGGVGWTAGRHTRPEAEVVGQVAAQDYQLPLRWSEGRSRDTRENAQQMLPLLAAAGVKQVLLVTHDAHMRRSLRAFETVAAPLGLRITPAPMGLVSDGLSDVADWTPSTGGFERVRYVIYEQLAWWAGH